MHDQWKIMDNTNHAFGWQRWLTLSNDRKVRQRRSAMLITGVSAAKALQLIRDYRMIPQWVNNAEETQLLKRDGKNFWVTFTMFDLPWPLKNKYLVTESRESRHKLIPVDVINITNSDKYNPPYACDVNEIGHYEAKWEVYELAPMLTFIEFTAFSTAEPLFPRWIQDPIVDRAFMKTMENFYALLLEF